MSETPDGQTLEGVRYALALMRGRLETAAPAHVPIIRSHIREVEALQSRAEDADTLRQHHQSAKEEYADMKAELTEQIQTLTREREELLRRLNGD